MRKHRYIKISRPLTFHLRWSYVNSSLTKKVTRVRVVHLNWIARMRDERCFRMVTESSTNFILVFCIRGSKWVRSSVFCIHLSHFYNSASQSTSSISSIRDRMSEFDMIDKFTVHDWWVTIFSMSKMRTKIELLALYHLQSETIRETYGRHRPIGQSADR
jgi:hypothetical protein